ncbi:MAG: type II secretion system protein GspG [bacterium]
MNDGTMGAGQARGGFTRTGWLLVVAMALLLFAAALFMVLQLNRSVEDSTRTTYAAIARMCAAVQAFELSKGRLPESLDELGGGTDSRDAWGHPLRYTKTGAGKFEVRSSGFDGKMDTPDDQMNPAWERF